MPLPVDVEFGSSDEEVTGAQVANEAVAHMKANTLRRMMKCCYMRRFEAFMMSTKVGEGWWTFLYLRANQLFE